MYKQCFVPPSNSLDLSKSYTKDIPNLSSFRNPSVVLDDNDIRTLETWKLPLGLKYLSMKYNKVSADGLLDQTLPSLEILNINSNRVYVLDESMIETMPALRALSATNTHLQTIHCLQTSSIQILIVDQNNIATLNGLPSTLKVLSAQDSKISLIQSRLPDTLEYAYLADNLLRYAGLPLRWGNQLKELDLSNNELEKFPRNLPDSLELLNLHFNKIVELPSKLPTSLRNLNLSHNRLRTVSSYKRNYSVPPIQIVTLTHNQLTDAFEQSPDWAVIFQTDMNWNTPNHIVAQTMICRAFKRFLLRKRVRNFARIGKIYSELLRISLHPDRICQSNSFSEEWKCL
jgi:Leucine-rich repeat (LRR) protein